jgi:hypothetical protein
MKKSIFFSSVSFADMENCAKANYCTLFSQKSKNLVEFMEIFFEKIVRLQLGR